MFDVGPWRLERVDPLGLAVGSRTSTDVGTVLVHPRVHNLTGPYGSMHTVEDEAVIRRSASDPLSGFVSLREYVDGDDPRLIHWPTSARMGTLMIREHVELRRPEFTVVLDAADMVADEFDFEEMVDVAASVAVHALRSGVEVRLRTTAREFPGAARPLERNVQVLDMLTPIHQVGPTALMSLPEIFRSGLDHTAIVFVTGPQGPSSLFSARRPHVGRARGQGRGRVGRHHVRGERRARVRATVAAVVLRRGRRARRAGVDRARRALGHHRGRARAERSAVGRGGRGWSAGHHLVPAARRRR